MNYRIRILTLSTFVFFTFLWSCDCVHISTGFVLDRETQKPIDSAKVESFLVGKRQLKFIMEKYTDTTGIFDIGTGLLNKTECEMDFICLISKDGYKPIIVNELSLDTIYLERIPIVKKSY